VAISRSRGGAIVYPIFIKLGTFVELEDFIKSAKIDEDRLKGFCFTVC
jgi:hypothetical protein